MKKIEKYILYKYLYLIEDFINNKISIEEFEKYYLIFFSDESYYWGDDSIIYHILESLFYDIDAYVTDDIYDPEDSENINKEELLKRSIQAFQKLKTAELL